MKIKSTWADDKGLDLEEEMGVEYDTAPTEDGFVAINRPDSFDAM